MINKDELKIGDAIYISSLNTQCVCEMYYLSDNTFEFENKKIKINNFNECFLTEEEAKSHLFKKITETIQKTKTELLKKLSRIEEQEISINKKFGHLKEKYPELYI